MKRFLVVAVCLLAAACGISSPGASPADDEQAIRAAFETHQKAVLANDGAAAVSVLSSNTFSTYDNIRKVALTGTEQEISALAPSGRLLAYEMRADVDPDTLRGASPKDLVRSVVDLGMPSKDLFTLQDVTLNDGKALGKVLVVYAQTTTFINFVREDGAWKVDRASLFELTDATLDTLSKREKVTPDQLIEQQLVAEYGQAKAVELHKPIGA